MTTTRKAALLGSVTLLAVTAVLWVSHRDDVSASDPEMDRIGGEEVALVAGPEEVLKPVVPAARAGERIRFAELANDLARDLHEAFGGAARRVRYASEAPGFLDPKTSPFLGAPDGRVILVELFDDLTVPIVLTETGVSRSGTQLIEGTVPGRPDSRFLMSSSGGAASMSIELSPDERFVINAVDEGVYEIVELDPSAVPPCAGPIGIFLDADVLAARSQDEVEGGRRVMARAANPSAHAVVDLLVVYSDDVAAEHSFLSIRNKTELAVAEGNSDLERSGARVRLRLVGVERLEYTENGSNSDALERLRRTNDGYLDEVHELRDEVGADLVCLLQEEEDASSSGIAYVMTKTGDRFSEDFGFSVVGYRYLTGLNTLVHEIGHNLGCNHDRDNSRNSSTLYPFSYGYRFTAGNGLTYRTIMAYRPGSRVSYFSTPLKTFGSFSDPLGIAPGLPDESDNVESLNRAAFEVSHYRLAEEGLDPEARMVNVSTRATVGTGEQALIGGFVIGSSEEKTILVRALGPSLAGYGVGDTLPALKVALYREGELLATNQGWRLGPDSQAVIDTGFAPDYDSEPAFLISVGSGAYTVVVESLDSRSGVALVEVYEIGDSGSRLINLSTRGYVGTDEEVLIGGFVIGGETGGTKRILIRALGPSLSGFGVTGAMFDPAVTLYDESGAVLLENDDWDYSNQQDVIAALGFAPDIRRESAMILDLAPGLYTAVVRPYENDDGQKPGIGLVEAYEIDVD